MTWLRGGGEGHRISTPILTPELDLAIGPAMGDHSSDMARLVLKIFMKVKGSRGTADGDGNEYIAMQSVFII